MPAPRGELLHHFSVSATHGQPLPIQASKITPKNHIEILKDHIYKGYEEGPGTQQEWQKLSEVPTAAEIMPCVTDSTAYASGDEEKKDGFFKDSSLPSNIIDGPWDSKEEYIAAHYKLLREDGIAPLRKAVEIFKAQPDMMDCGDVCIYTQVFIVGYVMSAQGPAPRIEFSHERSGKRIRWTQSKRLQQGTIVALTPRNDMFRSICSIAVVAARPISGVQQNPPQIDLFWGDENEAQFDPTEEYIMIEARLGYFEAYRHMLVAMQKLMTESFPLSNHLAKLHKNIGPPQYLEKQPLTNLSALVPRSLDNNKNPTTGNQRLLIDELSNVDVLDKWPTIPNTSLDESQLIALKRILAKKLAIVQGPPGTGKTFVSVSALMVMLDNWSAGDPPIIVSAQTNHAIDQLLTKLASLNPDLQTSFIRLGGRASEDNKLVLERTLYEVKQKDKDRKYGRNAGNRSFINCWKAVEGFGDMLISDINRAMNQTDDEIQMLLEADIITKEQYGSLHDDDWVCANDPNIPLGIMASWLGSEQLVAAPKCEPTNFGFEEEEIDEDFEELEEQEAEQKKKEDDDIDALHGKQHMFKEGFTGRHTPGYSDKKIRRILKTTKSFWDVDIAIRGEVYLYLRRQLKKSVLDSFRQHFKSQIRSTKNLKVARWDEDCQLMGRVGIKLVGCTTTGLSKYRGLLASLQPRILLVEEAAETLEGTVLAAQFETLQHLILVGDHQQLQANCNITALGKAPYNLAISMFERLVGNGIEFTMLNKQRRMISEIRKLLNDVYPNLQDHEAVLDREVNRKPVPGMGGRDTYWFHHTWPERRDEAASRYNIDEAQMISSFFAYLVLNGLHPSQITVLTFYNGQRKVLIKELRANPHLRSFVGFFKVFTVDSYQGEENDIILLSLVRSNNFAEIGFLENMNRAVVSLSRARRGMYIFGNVNTLLLKTRENEKGYVWRFVTGKLGTSDPPRLDRSRGLPLLCLNHRKETMINEPQDFDQITGGCTLKCNGELPCGHACPYFCHPFTHDEIVCKEPCKKTLFGCKLDHACNEICGNSCRCSCDIRVQTAVQDTHTQLYQPTLDDVMGEASSRPAQGNSRTRPTVDSQVSMVCSSLNSGSSQFSNNAWNKFDAHQVDQEIARAQASKSASPVKQPTNAPTFRDIHRPVIVENGSRREMGIEAATTCIILTSNDTLKEDDNISRGTGIRTQTPTGFVRGHIIGNSGTNLRDAHDSGTSSAVFCGDIKKSPPGYLSSHQMKAPADVTHHSATNVGTVEKPQYETDDLISFD